MKLLKQLCRYQSLSVKGIPMYFRKIYYCITVCLFLLSTIQYLWTVKGNRVTKIQTAVPTSASPQRDEKLWQKALEIHRRAIVIDTHNDITTPMANDDYDLSGTPPTPYRTSIARMKQGGMTAEFFSLYIKPWYVTHGGAARRTLDMIDSV